MAARRRSLTERPVRPPLEVDAAALRRMARDQLAELAAIRRRPIPRLALAVDRRVQRLARLAGAPVVSEGGARLTLLGAGLTVGRAHRQRRRAELDRAVEALAPVRADRRRTVVVVEAPTAAVDLPPFLAPDEVVVARPVGDEGLGAAVDRVVAGATGDLVCLIHACCEPLESGWLDRLAARLDGDVMAAVPQVVHPERRLWSRTPHDLRVRHLGAEVVVEDGAPVLVAIGAGARPSAPELAGGEVVTAVGPCLVVDREAFLAAGGLGAYEGLDVAIAALCSRLADHGARTVAVPESVVLDRRPVRSRAALVRPVVPAGADWRRLLDERGPALRRRGSGEADRLRVAVSTAALPRERGQWGDWELGAALARALRRRGAQVRVQDREQVDDPASRACDVHLVLRGLVGIRRSPGQRHVLWVISHPELVAPEECDEADLVLAASPRLAEHLRDLTDTPVEVLLQGTDHHRFRPVPPVPEHTHPVTVVANTRNVFRPAVAGALAAGIRPAIYGRGWEHLVAHDLIVAEHVANEQLPEVYASAAVVLNDHWATMRAWGIVSNRVYDVLACGTPVVSDRLPEIDDQLPDGVLTFDDADELGHHVCELLADPMAAARRAEAGRAAVLAAHTLDHRADQLLALLARYGLDRAQQ